MALWDCHLALILMVDVFHAAAIATAIVLGTTATHDERVVE